MPACHPFGGHACGALGRKVIYRDGAEAPVSPTVSNGFARLRGADIPHMTSAVDQPSQESRAVHQINNFRDTTIPLNDGTGVMPAAGFGTLIADANAVEQAVKSALEAGFRHIDCAELYRTEDAVGQVLQEVFQAGTVRREDLFITSKLWNTNHRPERVKPALERSLSRLQVDHLDCYLIHTPFAFPLGDELQPRDANGEPVYDTGVTLLETWRAMESMVDEGLCRSIGLSDITLDKLKEIVAVARIKPAVVQVECHPYLPEWELLEFCREQGMVLLAFAPLGHGMEPRVTQDPVIEAIAARVQGHACSPVRQRNSAGSLPPKHCRSSRLRKAWSGLTSDGRCRRKTTNS